MSKNQVILTAIAVLVIVGIAVAWFIFGNIQEPKITVVQPNIASVEEIKQLTETEPTLVTRKGAFKDADAIHKGSGTATVVGTLDGPVLKFEEDFSVTNGPDLFVYLYPSSSRESGEFISLGRLQSTSGAQVYALPENYEDYSQVVIWCRAFSTTFATADLQ